MKAIVCLFKGHSWVSEPGDFISHCSRCPAYVDASAYMR